MAIRKKNNNGAGASILVFLIVVSVIYGIVNCIVDFIKENLVIAIILIVGFISILLLAIIVPVLNAEKNKKIIEKQRQEEQERLEKEKAEKRKIENQRRELLNEILKKLDMEDTGACLKEYDDVVVVKSRQALDNYTDLKYFKENDIEKIKEKVLFKGSILVRLNMFLSDNDYRDRPQYDYVQEELVRYRNMANKYILLVNYITSAGNTFFRILY